MYRMVLFALTFVSLLTAGCAHTPKSVVVQAEDVAQDARRDTAQARELNDRAVGLIEKQKYDEAEKALDEALASDIMFGPAHNNLGKVYYQQGKLYQAAIQFQYATKLMPHQPEPLNNLGLVFEASMKLDDAVTQYAQAMEMQPDNPQFIGNAARARIRRGDRGPEVRELLAKLVERDTRPEWVEWAKGKLSLMGKKLNADN